MRCVDSNTFNSTHLDTHSSLSAKFIMNATGNNRGMGQSHVWVNYQSSHIRHKSQPQQESRNSIVDNYGLEGIQMHNCRGLGSIFRKEKAHDYVSTYSLTVIVIFSKNATFLPFFASCSLSNFEEFNFCMKNERIFISLLHKMSKWGCLLSF